MNIITSGGLSALLLEVFKWIYRKVVKNPELDFHPNFYLVALPVMNILVIPLMSLLGVEGVELPTEWVEFARSAVQVLVGSLIAVLVYGEGIRPLKNYVRAWNGHA